MAGRQGSCGGNHHAGGKNRFREARFEQKDLVTACWILMPLNKNSGPLLLKLGNAVNGKNNGLLIDKEGIADNSLLHFFKDRPFLQFNIKVALLLPLGGRQFSGEGLFYPGDGLGNRGVVQADNRVVRSLGIPFGNQDG